MSFIGLIIPLSAGAITAGMSATSTSQTWVFPTRILNNEQTLVSQNFISTSTKSNQFQYASTTMISSTLSSSTNERVSSLTSGNCLQAGAGGLLTTVSTPCGTITGSGTSPQLAYFTAAQTVGGTTNITYPPNGGGDNYLLVNLSTPSGKILDLTSVGTSVFKVQFDKIEPAANILFQSDNAYNIGAVGANRPANVYVGTSLTAPTISGTNVTASAALTGDTLNVGAGNFTVANTGHVQTLENIDLSFGDLQFNGGYTNVGNGMSISRSGNYYFLYMGQSGGWGTGNSTQFNFGNGAGADGSNPGLSMYDYSDGGTFQVGSSITAGGYNGGTVRVGPTGIGMYDGTGAGVTDTSKVNLLINSGFVTIMPTRGSGKGFLGVGSTTPTAMVVVASSTPFTNLLQITGISNLDILTIDKNQHQFSSTTAPTVSSGGIDGTDQDGRVTGCASACTVTFNKAYTKTPHCILSPESGSVVNTFTYTLSTTAIVVTETGLGTFDYICRGK